MVFFPNSIDAADNISKGTYHRNNRKRGDDRESYEYSTENSATNNSKRHDNREDYEYATENHNINDIGDDNK